MKKNNAQKRKTKYAKPEIKSYLIRDISKGWDFEAFGICIPFSSGISGTSCCSDFQ